MGAVYTLKRYCRAFYWYIWFHRIFSIKHSDWALGISWWEGVTFWKFSALTSQLRISLLLNCDPSTPIKDIYPPPKLWYLYLWLKFKRFIRISLFYTGLNANYCTSDCASSMMHQEPTETTNTFSPFSSLENCTIIHTCLVSLEKKGLLILHAPIA